MTRRVSLLLPAVLVAAALAATPACAAVAAGATCAAALDGAPLEPGVGFGGLRLGMTADEVEALIGPAERSERAPWEYPSCGFAIMFRDGELAAILGGDGTGGGPELTERFTVRTADGLGMGSTREELVAAMGEPSEQRGAEPMPTRIDVPESELIFYPGISWTLRGDRVEHVVVRQLQTQPAN